MNYLKHYNQNLYLYLKNGKKQINGFHALVVGRKFIDLGFKYKKLCSELNVNVKEVLNV